MNRTALAATIGFLLTAIVSPVPAQPVSAPTVSPDVKTLVDQAERDAAARRYGRAVDGFIKAWETSRQPAFLYNIAVLYLMRLNDPVLAWTWGKRFERHAANDADRKDAGAFLVKAEEALARTRGKVVIDVLPASAEVWIDEKSKMGRSEWPVAWLPPGEHKVMAEAQVHDPAEAPVSVTAGGIHEVKLALKPMDATLRVECAAPGCEVSVDGGPAARAPLERKVRPGRHSVSGTAAGFVAGDGRTELGPGESGSISLTLAPVPPPPVPVVVKPVERPTTTNPMRTWAWATTGTSAALLTTGTVLFILAKKDMTAAGNVSCAKFTSGEECDEAYDSKVSSARIKGYTAYALWGLGAAAAGAAVYMHVRASGARAGVMPWGSGVTAIVEW